MTVIYDKGGNRFDLSEAVAREFMKSGNYSTTDPTAEPKKVTKPTKKKVTK
jgi:hypothetical protein